MCHLIHSCATCLLVATLSFLPAAEIAPASIESVPKQRGSFETHSLPILALQTLDLGDGFRYEALQVELAGQKVWATSVLGLGTVQVGDVVQIMVHKLEQLDPRTNMPRKSVMIQVMPDFSKQLRQERTATVTAPAGRP